MTHVQNPSPEDRADNERRFLHHPPTGTAVVTHHDSYRRHFVWMANELCSTLPKSRELSLALTALEECSFWAHAAVARGQVSFPGEG